MVTARNKLAAWAVLLVVAIVVFAALLAGFAASRTSNAPKPPLGLVTSLPIYWPQTATFEDLMAEEAPIHWARAALERDYTLLPIDSVAADGEPQASADLKALSRLIIAQPRAFSPLEFAALDSWVRAGGRVLTFADPVLTEESDLALGDPGRPASAALLSPVFTKWGLRQNVDDSQPDGAYQVPYGAYSIPVEQAGFFEVIPGDADCSIETRGLIARCAIGTGQALVISDAHLLDAERGGQPDIEVLLALADEAFGS